MARVVATVAVLPRLMMFRIWSGVLGADRALQGSTQALANVPGLRGEYLRRAFLQRVIARCAPTVTVGYGTIFSAVGAVLEENVYIGAHCHLGFVHIERNVLVADGVGIPSGAHTHGTSDPGTPIREQPRHEVRVRIGAGSWIGSNAIIMADVGRNSVVGAGSVVTKSIPDDVVAAGVPARVLKPRINVMPVDQNAS